jgi:hypothetical protein
MPAALTAAAAGCVLCTVCCALALVQRAAGLAGGGAAAGACAQARHVPCTQYHCDVLAGVTTTMAAGAAGTAAAGVCLSAATATAVVLCAGSCWCHMILPLVNTATGTTPVRCAAVRHPSAGVGRYSTLLTAAGNGAWHTVQCAGYAADAQPLLLAAAVARTCALRIHPCQRCCCALLCCCHCLQGALQSNMGTEHHSHVAMCRCMQDPSTGILDQNCQLASARVVAVVPWSDAHLRAAVALCQALLCGSWPQVL